MISFVFRITDACDKGCPTCCCDRRSPPLSPDRFRDKLRDIQQYASAQHEQPVLFLTGGEPFLYAAQDRDGKPCNIVDLVQMIQTLVPDAAIGIKTSGWTPHAKLDGLLADLEARRGSTLIDVRLGFNLYQNLAARAGERLYHMMASILAHQSTIRIDIIYDKSNVSDTLDAVASVLARLGLPEGMDLQAAISPPEMRHTLTIPFTYNAEDDGSGSAGGSVILDLMPAYPGVSGSRSDVFWDAIVDGVCPIIARGSDTIGYNPDLSFYHCCDAFVDYSIPAFSPFESVEAEFEFLEDRFARLRRHLEQHPLATHSRRRRCAYCTHFMHDVPLPSSLVE